MHDSSTAHQRGRLVSSFMCLVKMNENIDVLAKKYIHKKE